MAFDLGTLTAKLGLDGSSFKKGIDDAGKELDRLNNSAKTAKDALVAIGTGAAAAKLYGTVKEWVTVADEAAIAFGKLELSISRAGSYANATAIKGLAGELQNLKNMDDEAGMSAAALLIKFGATESQVRKMMPLIADMGAETKNYEGAAMAMGRALSGNYRALMQYGVFIDEATSKTLAAMSPQEKMAALFDLINAKVGGTSDMLRNTFSGAMDQVSLQAEEVQQALGEIFKQDFIDTAQNVAEIMRSLANWLSELSKPTKMAIEFSVIVGGTALAGASLAKFLGMLGVTVGGATAAGVAGAAVGGIAVGTAINNAGLGNAIQGSYDLMGMEKEILKNPDAYGYTQKPGDSARSGPARESLRELAEATLEAERNLRIFGDYTNTIMPEYVPGNELGMSGAETQSVATAEAMAGIIAGGGIPLTDQVKKLSDEQKKRAEAAEKDAAELDKWILDRKKEGVESEANRLEQYYDLEEKARSNAYDADYLRWKQEENNSKEITSIIDKLKDKQQQAVNSFNDAILGQLQSGGISGFAGAAAATQFGSAAAGPIGQVVQEIQKLFENIAGAISNVADSVAAGASEIYGKLPTGEIGKFAGNLMGRVGNVAGSYTKSMGESAAMGLAGPLGMVGGIINQILAGPKMSIEFYTALGSSVLDLISKTDAYGKIQEAVDRQFQKLVDTLEPAESDLRVVIEIIEQVGDSLALTMSTITGGMMQDGFDVFMGALQGAAALVLWFNAAIASVIADLTGMMKVPLDAMGAEARATAGLEGIYQNLGYLNQEATIAAYNARAAADEMISSTERDFRVAAEQREDEAERLSYLAAKEAAKAEVLGRSMGELNDELQEGTTNLPSWYRANLAVYNASGVPAGEGTATGMAASAATEGGILGTPESAAVGGGPGAEAYGTAAAAAGGTTNVFQIDSVVVQTDNVDVLADKLSERAQRQAYATSGAYSPASTSRFTSR